MELRRAVARRINCDSFAPALSSGGWGEVAAATLDDQGGVGGHDFDSAPPAVALRIGRDVAGDVPLPQAFDNAVILLGQSADRLGKERFSSGRARQALKHLTVDFRAEANRVDRRIDRPYLLKHFGDRVLAARRGPRAVLVP